MLLADYSGCQALHKEAIATLPRSFFSFFFSFLKSVVVLSGKSYQIKVCLWICAYPVCDPWYNCLILVSIFSTVSRTRSLACPETKLSTLRGLHGQNLKHVRIPRMNKIGNLSQVRERVVIIFSLSTKETVGIYTSMSSSGHNRKKIQAKLLRRPKEVTLWFQIMLYR